MAGKSLSHMKLYHRTNYPVLALFIPLGTHSRPRSDPGPRQRSYPELAQALRVGVDFLRSQNMAVLV